MFEDRAKQFVDHIDRYGHRFDEARFLGDLKKEEIIFFRNEDKIQHLLNIKLNIESEKQAHIEGGCTHQEDGTCQETKKWNKCLFFVDQELDVLGEKTLF